MATCGSLVTMSCDWREGVKVVVVGRCGVEEVVVGEVGRHLGD